MQDKRVALITGANKGIGLQIAKDLVGHLPRTRPLTTDRLFLSSRGLRLTGPGRNGHAQAK